MAETHQFAQFLSCLRRRPDARAVIAGSDAYPEINGIVRFYQTERGVLVATEVTGLPGDSFYAFHIHGGDRCAGNEADPFADAMTHYNPDRRPHPDHAGDLPPLLANGGCAFSVVLTDRFTVQDILGRTVIIHDRPDDFTTQPNGNSGAKIACGEIRLACRLR